MHRFKKIAAVLNLKKSNTDVLAHLQELVNTNQAEAHLLCILPDKLTVEQQRNLEESIREKVKFDFSLTYINGKPVIEITQYSYHHQLDMILIEPDSQESKINRFFYGSLALSLLRKTPCPVWIVKKPVTQHYQRMLIAVDPEQTDHENALNDKLIQIGTSYAKRQSAECYLVTAWWLTGESTLTGPFINTPADELARLKDERKAECAIAFEELQARHQSALQGCETVMLYGEPGYAIPEFVQERHIDLIVMGTLARGGIQGFLIGNTAEAIVNQVDCSIMAIKPDDFISPILQ